ncbi:hypothetical protein [Bacillus alkalicellulosilyticus]|uniref:hypothetical protein n=1 Tax=Alkalihalobacterium alkalicellulosilyticum TaxID=1912214 RepID=UPI00099607DC|nr:hypothetical protein [Bacillus alkalicellulosilyticus]
MTDSLQIFMEYKIKQENLKEYEQAMEDILAILPEYEATNIQWFVASDQPFLYVEMFELPTKAHYHVLKKLRRSTDHAVFSKIVPFIEGGTEKIHCWAFHAKA